MCNQENAAPTSDGKVLATRHYRISFDVEAQYLDVPFHPDDQRQAEDLREMLLANEDLLRRILICHSADRLEIDMARWFTMEDVWETASRDVMESLVRSAPIEVVQMLMYSHLDGFEFAEELTGDSIQSTITSMQVHDLDNGVEVLPISRPEPLFPISEYQQVVLAKTRFGWMAGMRVRINRATEEERKRVLLHAIQWIDQIQVKTEGIDLPFMELDMGIIVSDQAEYEEARAKLSSYAEGKLPGIKTNIWCRYEGRMPELSLNNTNFWGLTGNKSDHNS